MIPAGLLVCGSAGRTRKLARVMRSVGIEAPVQVNPEEAAAALESLPVNPLPVLVFDAGETNSKDAVLSTYQQLSGHPLATRSVLVCDLTSREDILSLLEDDLLHHLVPASPADASDRLGITLAGLVSSNPLGIAAVAPWGVCIQGLTVTSNRQKQTALDHMAQHLAEADVKSRFVDLMGAVADEFLMNALFDAPVDAAGKHLFADRPRDEVVELPSPHSAKIRYCCTGERAIVSVTDTYGSLDPKAVRTNLIRALRGGEEQIRMGTAGAGVGLFVSFWSLADWIIEVLPEQHTHMIGIAHIGGGFRAHTERPKSFDLFVR